MHKGRGARAPKALGEGHWGAPPLECLLMLLNSIFISLIDFRSNRQNNLKNLLAYLKISKNFIKIYKFLKKFLKRRSIF